MKVVINKCFGGFGISQEAYERLMELGVPCRDYLHPKPLNEGNVIFINKNHDSILGKYWDDFLGSDRSHPLLIQVVEELGDRANGACAKLRIVEIPDGTDYEISEYDGMEHIAEKHRTWG